MEQEIVNEMYAEYPEERKPALLLKLKQILFEK